MRKGWAVNCAEMPKSSFETREAEKVRQADTYASLFRFRAKAVQWVEFRPPLSKQEVSKPQDCFGDCDAVGRARDTFLYKHGARDLWDREDKERGFGIVQMARVYSDGLGRLIYLGVCPQCQTIHWSEMHRKGQAT
ncbi:hypothetical protein DAERI_030092 [Deinococcus aerius]|uniref:Uncharacterized protein n=1 Tax=Deinococcus aerius TaxID=200253 RepID=A0A2I9D322_9DEIO|nr:hypothetical protein [Deinococcus aerius]GBF04926.1 hypothetical protein DAERI_030092 [Deinococcus aerius]